MHSELLQYYKKKKYQKLQSFDQTIFLSKFAKNCRVSVFYTQMYMNYKEMHPTFWDSFTLIDHKFGTKSPFDLEQKKKNNIKLRFCSFLLCYSLSFGRRTKVWNPDILLYPP